MLNSEVFDIMMGRLGRREAPLMRTICIQELNIAKRELERGPTKPWFLETSATGNLIADQDYINLPTNFLIEIEEGTFELENEDEGWIELTKVTRERVRKETANVDPAFPEGYAIWGKTFLFGPKPDSTYAYRFDYYARTSDIADNGSEVTNDWLLEFFDYLVYKTLIVVAQDHIKDTALANGYVDKFKFAKDAFEREVTARQVANETKLLTDEES